MQSVSDDDVRKRLNHEKPRFELAVKGVYAMQSGKMLILWRAFPVFGPAKARLPTVDH